MAGLNLAPAELHPGDTLNLQLVWHVLRTPSERYRAFVHVADADGRIVAQSDAEPANWTRPTTGWLPGEYVVDAHAIVLPADLPPGSYSLIVGLAEVDSGMRAAASGPGVLADGRAFVGTLQVGP